MSILRLNTNIEAWLYKAAKYQIKIYLRKKKNDISIEELSNEYEQVSEADLSEHILSEIITEDEIKTITDFYVSGESIDIIAKDNKLSQNAAYQKIRRIKQKIIKRLDDSNKLHK